MEALIYDIETIPLSDARLDLVEPEHKAPGNLKDPAKIEAAIAEKAAEWRERAALSPLTGRVAMVGTKFTGCAPEILHLAFPADDEDLDMQETLMLQQWWSWAGHHLNTGSLLIGFNSHGFDIPFMVKRSWALKVKIPPAIDIFAKWGLTTPWIDLMKAFQLGDRTAPFTSLNSVAALMGLGQKEGDCLQLRHQLEHEPEAAIAYLRQDLALTETIAQRMGICS
jgi:hypothetical protein